MNVTSINQALNGQLPQDVKAPKLAAVKVTFDGKYYSVTTNSKPTPALRKSKATKPALPPKPLPRYFATIKSACERMYIKHAPLGLTQKTSGSDGKQHSFTRV